MIENSGLTAIWNKQQLVSSTNARRGDCNQVKKKFFWSKACPSKQLQSRGLGQRLLAFGYSELGQSHYWAVANGPAWPGSRLWAGPGKSLMWRCLLIPVHCCTMHQLWFGCKIANSGLFGPSLGRDNPGSWGKGWKRAAVSNCNRTTRKITIFSSLFRLPIDIRSKVKNSQQLTTNQVRDSWDAKVETKWKSLIKMVFLKIKTPE